MATIGSKNWGTKSWGYTLPDAATLRTRLADTIGQGPRASAAFADTTRSIARTVAEQNNSARQLAIGLELGTLYDTMAAARYRTDAGGSNGVTYRELTSQQAIVKERTLYRNLARTEQRDVFEARDILGTEDVFETRDILETRDLLETRDVFETRDIFETRELFETRPVYESRDILRGNVEGTRTLTGFATPSDAGIGNNSDMAVSVGTGATATVRFTNGNRITVTQNGSTTNFSYASSGDWRQTLATALSSIDGLDASIDAGGSLDLRTHAEETLTLAEVSNGFFDFSANLLPNLGLGAGTYEPEVVGTEQIQTGTEDVLVGTEQVLVGTEDVLVGTEEFVVGTESVVIGSEQILIGQQDVVIGTEQVKTGTETITLDKAPVAVGTEFYTDGTREISLGMIAERAAREPARETLTAASQRALRERAVGLERAIGRAAYLPKDDPYRGLAAVVGLDQLGRIETRSELETRMAFVQMALKMVNGTSAGAADAYARNTGTAQRVLATA